MLENRKKISFSTSVLNCIPHHVVNIIYFSKSVKESNNKEQNISVECWLITSLNRNYSRKISIICFILFIFVLLILWKHLCWNRPLRWSNPTISQALPSPPFSHTTTCHVYTLNISRDGDHTTSLGSLFQDLTTLSLRNLSYYPIPRTAHLEALSFHSVTCYLGEVTDPYLTITFQAVTESNTVPLSILLQNK